MSEGDDARFMSAALALGRRGLGRVWPNPSVGCVIVRDGRIVGRGATGPGGRPHGERLALDRAGPAACGATAYVTLEPCAHHGRTPPCAEALIAAGVSRVVVPIADPDPRVSGRGLAMLRDAGLAVTEGVLADAARADHLGFLTRAAEGRPMVTLKLAASLDGRIATATGESRWITGPGARRVVHALRLAHDAVLVGGGTARTDDPDLTVRGMGPVPQPVRVIAARRLDLPRDGRLARTARDVPLWLVHGECDVSEDDVRAWHDAGAELLSVPVGPGSRLDPSALVRALGDRGLTRVLCEGGGALAASLLQARLVDRIVWFSAGLALGAEGRPAIGALGLDALGAAPRFRLSGEDRIGPDVVTRWDRAD